jgi:hypothetical protein
MAGYTRDFEDGLESIWRDYRASIANPEVEHGRKGLMGDPT